jgi:hypothetical protein
VHDQKAILCIKLTQGVGKKTMYKVLKDSQKEFVDLSQISCDDIETSVAVGRKFVARLYDPKARFTCDHGDLNKYTLSVHDQKAILCIKLTQACYIYHGQVGSVDSL